MEKIKKKSISEKFLDDMHGEPDALDQLILNKKNEILK